VVAGAHGRPTICLNLIVKNEAHVIHEMIDAVAPYISYWVIVDTGSTDGTQDAIRGHMQRLGIPGELHERPWRDFGHNRSEALQLAQGHCDYIWVMDADDTVVGTIDFSGLTADGYTMRIDDGVVYWRPQLFRDGVPWRYQGVLHELGVCDVPHTVESLDGDYRILSRRIGGRNLDPDKYLRDAEVLLAEHHRRPGDPRTVFYLAQSYYCYGDFENSRKWDQHRADMGGWEEEVYYSMFRVAEAMAKLGEPWPEVQDAYLRAWNFRPSRAEALHALARHCRIAGKYSLGHLFAQRVAQLPPTSDVLFVNAEVQAWRALDEQAVCASWTGRQDEAFAISRQLVARDDLPEEDRQRIEANRDLMVPSMLEVTLAYPADIPRVRPGADAAQVTMSLVSGPDRSVTEQTLNSFIRCCSDADRIDRFLVLDAGMSEADRSVLFALYPFLEFIPEIALADAGDRLRQVRQHVTGRHWMHIGGGWRFFAPEPLISRTIAVLDAEPEVFQVGVNFSDATGLIGRCAEERTVRRARGTGRYVLTNTVLNGPAMFEVQRCDYALGNWRPGDPLHTATLDEVLCIAQQ
jgi:glycosyltransferase involved in cell wall biosynthesis